MTADIEKLLGAQAKALLEHRCTTIPKESIHLPGPDYVERIYSLSDRPTPVLRSLQQLLDHGRLAGSGYVSILPVDQGIEHSAAASFAPNPIYFDASTSPETELAPLVLEPGDYVLNAKVLVGNISGDSSEDISCALRWGASDLIDQGSVRPSPGAPFSAGSLATLALAGSISLTSSDTVRVNCTTSIGASSTYPSGAFAQFAKLNAVRVETITP